MLFGGSEGEAGVELGEALAVALVFVEEGRDVCPFEGVVADLLLESPVLMIVAELY